MAVSDDKFSKLEERVAKLEVKSAVDYERHVSIMSRLDRIDGHISKLVWLIMTAIVSAFIAFVIRGGLNVG